MSINTPFDDVFRTMLNDCTQLIIPVINEIFGEHYNGTETIVFLPNEHFLNQPEGGGEKRITDSNFRIIALESKKYHLECQSTPDDSMLIRFFEYDTQIALDEGNLQDNRLLVTFPHSAVLFLRSNSRTPDQMTIQMDTPGGSVSYEIPVMKVQRYRLQDIFEKNLLFLIPFYIFTHEKELDEYNKNSKKLEILKAEYAEIRNRLEILLKTGSISEYMFLFITDMSNKVLQHLAGKYENVKKGVETIMGGKVLEHTAKTIKREGIKEGMLTTLFDLVQKGLLSVQDAAAQAKLSEEAFIDEMNTYKN